MEKAAIEHVPELDLVAQGIHNSDLEVARGRLIKGSTYKDLSTILIVPTRGVIPVAAVRSWMGLIQPMNQKLIRMFVEGDEVGQAYCNAIDQILAHPDLRTWKYILTLEEDNLPPPDGLLKLYETIEGQSDGNRYDAVGGLYWTKGEGGQPMIYGNPNVYPKNFVPQLPQPGEIVPCNGLGMGFTLFRMEMFTSGRIEKPLFKTLAEWNPQVGGRVYTQDLYFFENAAKAGYRFAADCRVLVGHLDPQTGIVW